eukprot:97055-Lingulodinium_polyedra.AAC.1
MPRLAATGSGRPASGPKCSTARLATSSDVVTRAILGTERGSFRRPSSSWAKAHAQLPKASTNAAVLSSTSS